MRKYLIISQWSYSPKIQLMKEATGTFPLRCDPLKQISFHRNLDDVVQC